MPIQAKAGGVYGNAVVSVKQGGAYVTAQGIYAKVAGQYVRADQAAWVAPTPILLEPFDSLVGWSAPNVAGTYLIDASDKVQGTGRMVLSMSTATGAGTYTNKTGLRNYSAAEFGTIVFCVDQGFDPELSQNGASLRFGQPTAPTPINYPSTAGISLWPDYGGATGDYILGKTWRMVHTADLAAAGAGLQDGYPTAVRVLTTTVAPATSPAKVDSLLVGARGRPTIVLTFDDGRNGPYNNLAYMSERGIRGTLYLPWENVAVATAGGSVLTVAKAAEMLAAGWDIQLDGTGDDSAITTRHTTVAQAVAHLADGKAFLASNGLNPDARHFCYPNGIFRVKGAQVQVASVTRNANSPICAMTSTAGIVAGQRAVGFGVPDVTRVLTVDSATQVTLTNNVTVSNTRAMSFTDDSGEFHTGKLQAGLRSAGWLTARTTMGGPIYSRYGIGDQGLILPGHTTTSAASGWMQAHIDEVQKYGATKIIYIHDIFPGATWINMDTALFREGIDALFAAKAAGLVDVLTLSEWYARDCANPATPPVA